VLMDSNWNETFLDAEASDYDNSDDSDDPGYDPSQSDDQSDDSENVALPPIQLRNTQRLREQMDGSLVERVVKVLDFMAGLGINLPIFLDALSWGDAACIFDAKVRYARTGLMKSKELPLILRQWWKPPRTPGSGNSRSAGATTVMEQFAQECTAKVMHRELEKLAALFKSPPGDDVAEEQLTGTSFNETINKVQKISPHLWSLLHGLAYREQQQENNTRKSPEKASMLPG
jgi:hypothetical protein